MRYALATAILLAVSTDASAAAQSGPSIEYFPAPALPDGRPAPFSTATRVGDVLYLSGQTGFTADGKLPSTFKAQAQQTMENIGATLKQHGLGWGDVFKCTVMLTDVKDWPEFNAVYVPYFPAGRLPARSAFGANQLALPGMLIELECMAWAGGK
jgi:enamine deaminase RidA (YjgF/YER057c/UK114 family)